MNKILIYLSAAVMVAGTVLAGCSRDEATAKLDPVDYVNPYIGNVSHLLVPTFPTIQLPNSLLRVYPVRADYTSEYIDGLPIIVTHHRERSAFRLLPQQGDELKAAINYNYDNEEITPYSYYTELLPAGETPNPEGMMTAEFSPSHQSALYNINFDKSKPASVVVSTPWGRLEVDSTAIYGFQNIGNDTRVYLYMEPSVAPETVVEYVEQADPEADAVAWCFADGTDNLSLRYGVSLISVEQAKANLQREIQDFDIERQKQYGRKVWNDQLSKIEVFLPADADPTAISTFYTSLYRIHERPICLSEDGQYWSAFDGKVHEDGGTPFYTDDWIWDTYRAAHPLRALYDQPKEEAILASYLRMAEQMGNLWMPTFPDMTGDSRRMNSNHAVATFADAYAKGLNANYPLAYEAARRGIEEKTLAPWSGNPAGQLDEFYKAHGYMPALRPGEKETDPNVNSWEKRQPIAVTLGTSYDHFCLSLLAEAVGDTVAANHYRNCALNYRNVFNPETRFFHPKDKNGNFIPDVDYRYSGGVGARDYYDENNGYVYRWDVPHNLADLVDMIGGPEAFVAALDDMYAEPLGKMKFDFYTTLPDHTGNVGQFSMANEPSMHVPYLYNYAGAPWKTQKRVRQMLDTWFRNDLMGVPGDEDGGGLTAFVVFSSLGFYPVTPGIAAYNIGSPVFEHAVVHLSNGKDFEIVAENWAPENKYIQSATLNGREWNQPWFPHSEIADGGRLVLVMGNRPNPAWASDPTMAPPSMNDNK